MGRCGFAASLTLLLAACTAGTDPKPHVVLITSDALRADHLSLFGYARATSPAIDAFASRAWNFTDAVSLVPKTAPSFATLFTGRGPQAHGVRSNFDAIPESLPVLAEQLRAQGYRSAAFIGNPVLRPQKGFSRGFDVYLRFDGRSQDGVWAVNRAFFEWAASGWSQPSFVWIHYMDPHGPYAPPAELERPFLDDALARADERVLPHQQARASGRDANKVLGAIPLYQCVEGEQRAASYIARYDAEIRNMDAAFAEVVEFLERRGLFDSSAIVFSSDHGESLGENDFWFEHGWFAHEAALHVPLLIKAPGQTTGHVVGRQVSSLDLLPTILGVAGAPADPGLGGVDLLKAPARDAAILIENSDRYPEKYYGARAAPWKYLRRESDGAELLYDLEHDPHEQRDLSASEPARLAELRAACDEALRRARRAAVPGSAGAPDDAETLERLKALGYVDD